MTSFRLNAGQTRSPNKVGGSDPVKPTRVRNRASAAVGTLVCGHRFYEPYVKRGKLIWCDDCQHNREIEPKPKPAGGVAPDEQGKIPF